jgi:uncharacterized damage-inducible protein DinB/heme-degrading monooxygenase HmoA
MITRIWHGKIKTAQERMYTKYITDTGIKDYLNTAGNMGVQILQKTEGDITHVYTVTQWKDMKSIEAFAGKDLEKAKYYEEDEKYLLDAEDYVTHYKSYSFSNTKINSYIRQFEQLYSGGSWQDESFEAKLQDLTEETAFMLPLPGVHCIAEIMWHSLYWRTVLIKRMEGNYGYRDETVDKYNFLSIETLKQKGWNNLWNEWKESQEQIIQYLKEKTDRYPEEKITGKDSLEYIVEGIIQHDIYHLGQIGLVKKIMSLK